MLWNKLIQLLKKLAKIRSFWLELRVLLGCYFSGKREEQQGEEEQVKNQLQKGEKENN